jgi:hypothetical protein
MVTRAWHTFVQAVVNEARRLRRADEQSKENYEQATGQPLANSTSDPEQIYHAHLASQGLTHAEAMHQLAQPVEPDTAERAFPGGLSDRAVATPGAPATHTFDGKEQQIRQIAAEKAADSAGAPTKDVDTAQATSKESKTKKTGPNPTQE